MGSQDAIRLVHNSDNDYDSSDSFGYEDFTTLGSSNVYDLVQVVTGSTSDDSYSETDFDNFTFSNYHQTKNQLSHLWYNTYHMLLEHKD